MPLRTSPSGSSSTGWSEWSASSSTTTAASTTIATCWRRTSTRASSVVHDWPMPFIGHRGRGGALQRAFEHCLGAHRDDSRWIAFLDLDEFLFSPTGAPLLELLREYEEYAGGLREPRRVRDIRASHAAGRAGDRELRPPPPRATRRPRPDEEHRRPAAGRPARWDRTRSSTARASPWTRTGAGWSSSTGAA